MARPVSVTFYAAEDGSLHDSPDKAERHDIYRAEEIKVAAIFDVIAKPIRNGALSPQCRLFDGGWDEDKIFDRDQLLESLSRLIIENWPAIEKALSKARAA